VLGAAERWAVLREADAVLGLDLAGLARRGQSDPGSTRWWPARGGAGARDFATADRIRRSWGGGHRIEDTPQGSRWRRA
jgi:hypothetical protein